MKSSNEDSSSQNDMNDEIDETLLVTILQKIHRTEPSIKRYEIIRNVIKAGNNYCSEIMKVRVEYEIDNVSRKKFFVLKVPHAVPAYQILAKNGMYRKESLMYEYILPKMSHSMGHDMAPQHYHTIESNSLLLEDLSASGYTMADRNRQLGLDECEATLRSLAAFHGASYAVQRTNSALVDAVARETFFVDRNFVKQRLEAALLAWTAIARRHRISSTFVQKLPSLIDPILDQLPAILSGAPYEFNVLNHGDLWTTNVLFKRDAQAGVLAAKMIDFQNCRWTSPANDIIIFATTSIKFDVFTEHLDRLLRAYLKTLNRTLADLGHSRVYTADELNRDLEKAKLFRIVVLATYLNVTLSDSDNAIFFENSEDGQRLNIANIDDTYNGQIYKSTMAKWLEYLETNRLY